MTGVITGTEPSSSVICVELAVRGAQRCILRGFTRHHGGLRPHISSFRTRPHLPELFTSGVYLRFAFGPRIAQRSATEDAACAGNLYWQVFVRALTCNARAFTAHTAQRGAAVGIAIPFLLVTLVYVQREDERRRATATVEAALLYVTARRPRDRRLGSRSMSALH